MSNDGRCVRFDPECDAAAEKLGGYEEIDDSLNIYYDALHRDPQGFDKVDTDFGSVRFIRTKPIGNVPELLWYFVIESNKDVLLVYVEKYHE